ncbi:MAG: hypothetical protein N2487_02375 [Verrucomicrobiae bacterium]|nr:hypothetical protein [Verrucomicrobiae bacterium]
MKKTITTVVCAVLGWTLCAAEPAAADKQKSELTPEQLKEQKALVEKYDANKDGKLDEAELAKMSQEDKAKWESLQPKKQGEEKSEKEGEKK